MTTLDNDDERDQPEAHVAAQKKPAISQNVRYLFAEISYSDQRALTLLLARHNVRRLTTLELEYFTFFFGKRGILDRYHEWSCSLIQNQPESAKKFQQNEIKMTNFVFHLIEIECDE